MAKLPFRPVVGTDAQIQQSQPVEGYVWFATDTKKIYYSDGVSFLSMGGNSNIFYGIMELEDTPDEGQTEFTFSIFDIDGNSDITDGNYIIPNVDDLILNIPDGCFYRVIELEDSGEDTIIYTTKLTIAGSGGGGGTGPGGGDSNYGKVTFDRITPATITCLYKQDYNLEFLATATDASGEKTGNGSYTVSINGKANVITGTVVNGKKTSVAIGPYLSLGENSVRVYVTMDAGGSSLTTQSKLWTVTTTQVELTWDYDETTLNSTNNVFNLDWEVSGIGIEKTTHIIIDDNWILEPITQKSNDFHLTISNLLDYNLTHGVHKIQMWVTFYLNETLLTTPTITKNAIFYTIGNEIPIISCSFFEDTVTQYNTIEIPIIFYQYGNTGTLSAVLKENDKEVDTWENIKNGERKIWYYTPLESTTRNLIISCGTIEKTLTLEVNALEIDNKEIDGYAFRFKASDFSSNTAIQNWKSGNVDATFSENFDWINGGLKSEEDEKGNIRQYLRIKAGTSMTINYNMFQTSAPAIGKAFKFIFKADSCRDYDALVLNCYDERTKIGLQMRAQQALIQGSENKLIIPYCEENYIEFEFDITKTDAIKRYLIPWLDGVPAALIQYGNAESFINNQNIIIGSPDCDVCVYMIKLYEKHLTDNQHLQNFIADAPNAQEMLDRYNRNDILDPERGVISPSLLAKKNPDCLVHVYDIDRMTLTKNDKIKGCTYTQYHGSDSPSLFADNVEIKVQGTSSASYGLSAFNIDSKFNNGFTYADGSTSEGWSMNPNSIPVNYFTTKVNVASCEQANNALNQDWYNKFQPYKTKVRQKNPNARDCMEFTPGVLFMIDHNEQADFINSGNFISNNLFAEIPGYIQDPYERMYSICNMGNSKKNISVLHDTTNPLEYCIEIADNQKPMQWMTDCDYSDTEWDAKEYFEFRYPDGHGELEDTGNQFISPLTGEKVSHRQHAFDAWRRFVTWMAHSNPQPKYKKVTINSAKEFEDVSTIIIKSDEEGKPDTVIKIDVFTAPEDSNGNLTGVHQKVEQYNENIQTYYILTDSKYGYTLEPLNEPQTFGNYEFKDKEYSSHLVGTAVTQYAGTYNYDTYEYRMAKMLSECEQYLVMDSVLFHYLFIERHTMIDNVSKNTFWSTEDGFHWNLTKNYDNDTADGNDNQGKLTLTYGIEPFDNVPGKTDDFYFNANQSVWFRFSGGLYEACKTLYKALESTGDKGKESAWDSKAYLKRFKDWQKTIPERCWIEDYYRKYIRPLEVYGDRMFVDMLEGGQKIHQRAQYETYQDRYISSKYVGNTATTNRIIIRGNGNRFKAGLPVSVYADCYIQASFGTGDMPNVTMRVKRNQPITIRVPSNIGTIDNATIYFFSPELYQTIGEVGRSNLNIFEPEQITVSPAVKLRTLVAGEYRDSFENNTLEEIGFTNNIMLEELYMANYPGTTLSLDLTNAVNLKTLDLRNSGFTGVYIADGAPIESIQLCKPSTISLSNLRNLDTLTFDEPNEITTIIINNIDNSIVNSKNDILDVCTGLSSYTLKNVKWEINSSEEIQNNKILILDRILNEMEPVTPQNQVELETSETSLTGSLTISSDAYNGSNALDIYNYYASEVIRTDTDKNGEVIKEYRRFPKLDINFEGENAKLYTVTILKDDTNVLWTRKLRPGDAVDEDFLSMGPDGAFNLDNIYKTSTSYYDYIFSGRWEIYDTDTKEYVGQVQNTNKLPIRNNVRQNLTFIPKFESSIRKWTVTLKQDNEILATIENIPAGTMLQKVLDENYPTIPYKSDDQLDKYMTYSFEGYAYSKTATSGLKADTYPVTNNMELYAIFKAINVYQNVHEDYWLFDLVSSNAYGAVYDNITEYQINKGYIISPNNDKNLRGKVTIPATYNGLPVYKIANNAFENNHSITHVFFETGSKLRVVGDRAFLRSNIKFFEFTDELRRIEGYAFSEASMLEPDNTNTYNFGNNLYYLGTHAFNQALNFNGNAVTFLLPSTLKTMGYYAISNLRYPTVNSTIMIGQPGEFSDLDLSDAPGSGNDTQYKRISEQTSGVFQKVTFYSKIYNSADELVKLDVWDINYTVGQMLGNDSVGVIEVEVVKG